MKDLIPANGAAILRRPPVISTAFESDLRSGTQSERSMTLKSANGFESLQFQNLHTVAEESREGLSLPDPFFEAMPRLRSLVGESQFPFQGVRVVLVHHLTREVLGLIAALRRMGCRDLEVVFIAYGGEIPQSFLDHLQTLPKNEVNAVLLKTRSSDGPVTTQSYEISDHLSGFKVDSFLRASLKTRDVAYFEAMQAVTLSQFARLLTRTELSNERCIVIEDGGYLAPQINRFALDVAPLSHALLSLIGLESVADFSREKISRFFLGSVEHTKSGYDLMQGIQKRFGGLAYPSISIALSRLKVLDEARDVAASVINATENVLHAMGKVLSRRNCMVMGSRGAIGRFVVSSLTSRLRSPKTQLLAVDPRVRTEEPAHCLMGHSFVEVGSTEELGGLETCIDLVIGVTGCDGFTSNHLKNWLLQGIHDELILVSGSSKLNEFNDLASWVERRASASTQAANAHGQSEQPKITWVSSGDVQEAYNSRSVARRHLFDVLQQDGSSKRKHVIYVAGLLPVNFLYYGVPTETIDSVLRELLECSIHLVQANDRLSARLHTVDSDFDLRSESLEC